MPSRATVAEPARTSAADKFTSLKFAQKSTYQQLHTIGLSCYYAQDYMCPADLPTARLNQMGNMIGVRRGKGSINPRNLRLTSYDTSKKSER